MKGKTEWKDETTLVFTPSHVLNEGKTYTGSLSLSKLGEVKERLKFFPLRIQTLKKDFRVTIGTLECSSAEGTGYSLHGEIITADYIEPSEVERYLTVKLGRRRPDMEWDHTDNLIHKFTITGIQRTDKEQQLTIAWDGTSYGIKQKGSSAVNIPQSGVFSVVNVISLPGENQRIEIVFSDPVDASQELDGLIRLSRATDLTVSTNSNIISVFPAAHLQGSVELNIEPSLKNNKGMTLSAAFSKQLDFTSIPPSVTLEGNGVILPASKNLIFPFKAANLRAVDLKIVKIFENNLPYFLQENDLNRRKFNKKIWPSCIFRKSRSGVQVRD